MSRGTDYWLDAVVGGGQPWSGKVSTIDSRDINELRRAAGFDSLKKCGTTTTKKKMDLVVGHLHRHCAPLIRDKSGNFTAHSSGPALVPIDFKA